MYVCNKNGYVYIKFDYCKVINWMIIIGKDQFIQVNIYLILLIDFNGKKFVIV